MGISAAERGEPPGRSDPRVVAHRGASAEVAEHTLAAYVAALDAGADGLECDVRLTADSHLVCVHDRSLRRVAGTPGLVSTMELAELDELDFASWKTRQTTPPRTPARLAVRRPPPPPPPAPLPAPEVGLDDEESDRDTDLDRVLTLRRLLETVADYDRRVEVAIETKHPTRYGGLVERRLVEMLREFGWDRRDAPVRVMSFSFTALQRVERLAPDLTLVQLIDKAQYWSMLRRVVGRDWILGPGSDLLRDHPRTARRIASSGHPVHVWVVNTAEELERCRALGVEAVITDRPAEILGLLGRGPSG